MVRNLVTHREPVNALGEWAAPFDPALLGLAASDAGALNDDGVGRALLRLFDADRASLLTELVLGAIVRFGIDWSQLHKDSTSVTFSGAYRNATGARRGGKATPAIAFGHNKDHRADLKQLVWVLTVTADGAVPIAHRVESGNTSADTTHIPTWDGLVALVGRADFLYVADTRLASRDAMNQINGRGGRFVTVLPRTRKETASSGSGSRPTPALDRSAPPAVASPWRAPTTSGARPLPGPLRRGLPDSLVGRAAFGPLMPSRGCEIP